MKCHVQEKKIIDVLAIGLKPIPKYSKEINVMTKNCLINSP